MQHLRKTNFFSEQGYLIVIYIDNLSIILKIILENRVLCINWKLNLSGGEVSDDSVVQMIWDNDK